MMVFVSISFFLKTYPLSENLICLFYFFALFSQLKHWVLFALPSFCFALFLGARIL